MAHGGRDVTETGRACRCGNLYPWDAVTCECHDLLVEQQEPVCCADPGDCSCEAAA